MNWFSGEVAEALTLTASNAAENKRKLNERQEAAVLRMMDVLRDTTSIETVYLIKRAVAGGDSTEVEMYWSDFTEDEQNALWVAPTYGGIFTTHERKMIRGDG